MTVIRFDPFGDPFRQLDRLTSQLLSGTRTPMGMAMDVWQADDGYHAVLDLPGVDASSVEITSERNVLTIAAERRPEYEQGQNVLVAERPQGRFTRQLQLGENLDTQNVEARYANGVLLDHPGGRGCATASDRGAGRGDAADNRDVPRSGKR